MRHPLRPTDGFTLLELVLVLAILGIVALAAIPSFTSGGTEPLDVAAAEVAAAVRFARSEALRTGTVHGARMVVATNQVEVFRLDGGGSRVFDVRHPLDKSPYTLDLGAGTFTSGVKMTTSDFRFGGGATPHEAVGFDPLGYPLKDSDLSPLDSGQVVLTLGATTRTVSVASVTGRVTVQ